MYLCIMLNYVTNYLFGLKLTERELLTKQPSDVILWGGIASVVRFLACATPQKTPPPLGRKKREKLKYKIE